MACLILLHENRVVFARHGGPGAEQPRKKRFDQQHGLDDGLTDRRAEFRRQVSFAGDHFRFAPDKDETLSRAAQGRDQLQHPGRVQVVGPHERNLSRRFRASHTAIALGGAVVSKPMAKNTTWRCGLAAATLTASRGE
jgi:hypothetical protein